MKTAREKALATCNHIRIAPGRIAKLRDEKTLHVTGAPAVWPAEAVARYCMRVALENGCTKINVIQGQHRRREFDVMDLISYTRTLTLDGNIAVPKMDVVPPDLATKGFAAVGSYTDAKKTLVTVPSQTLVSSPNPGQEGASNGK
jgi:hypothetical protein